jgi:hypothetical protein
LKGSENTQEALSWRLCLAMFALAAVVASLHHLLEPGIKTALQFDGRHYFESCQRMTALILAAASCKSGAVAAAEQALRPWILLDGPILPLLFAPVFALSGGVPASSKWSLILIVQIALQAGCVVMISLLVHRLTRNTKAALAAGFAWAVYPAALIASGRLMTETLACFLLLSLPLLCDLSRKRVAIGVVSGLVAAVLILLKPAMIPSVVLTIAALVVLAKERKLIAVGLLVGLIVGLSPWFVYTKMATGTASVTVQRLPVHNVLIGWDPETGGWQTSPASAFEKVMNYGDAPLPVVAGIWRSHPQESLRILFEKFGHLLLNPWNDYRASVFGLNAECQQAWHLLLLSAFVFGAAAAIAANRKQQIGDALLLILCLAAASGQLVCLLVEPVCRYAFALMGFAPLMAAVGLDALICARAKDEKRLVALAASVGTVFTLVLLSLSARSAALRLNCSAVLLTEEEALETQFRLERPIDTKCDTAVILIDGDKRLNADLYVDGRLVDSELVPFALLDKQRRRSFNLLREFSYTFGKRIEDFRQWRAMPIPIELLRGKRIVKLQLRQKQGEARVYSDPSGKSELMFSQDQLDVNRMINSPSSMEPRILDATKTKVSIHNFLNHSSLEMDKRFLVLGVHLAVGRPLAVDSSDPVDAGKSTADGVKSSTEAATQAGQGSIPSGNKSAAGRESALSRTKSEAAETGRGSAPSRNTSTAAEAGRRPVPPGSGSKSESGPGPVRSSVTMKIGPEQFPFFLRDTQKSAVLISRAVLQAASSNYATVKIPNALLANGLAKVHRGPNAAKPPTYLRLTVSGEVKSDKAKGALGLVLATLSQSGTESLLPRLPGSIPANQDWQPFTLSDLLPLDDPDDYPDSLKISLFPGPWQQVAGYGCDKTCSAIWLRNLTLKFEPVFLPSFSNRQIFYY